MRKQLSARRKSDYKETMKLAAGREPVSSVSGGESFLPKDFSQYCSYIGDKIDSFLEKNGPIGLGRQDIGLNFVLTSGGFLKGRPILSDNVDERVRDAVIKSLEEASPFPSFPKDHNQEEETFKLNISFEESLCYDTN